MSTTRRLTAIFAAGLLAAAGWQAQAQQATANSANSANSGKPPNILVIFGDDIGQANIFGDFRDVSV